MKVAVVRVDRSNCLRMVRASALWLMASVASAMSSPNQAEAACNGTWDISGQWSLRQTNGYTVQFSLRQAGNSISGTGGYSIPGGSQTIVGIFPSKSFGANINGTVSGTINGNSFSFVASWGGEYTGAVDSQGFIGGSTFDRNSPANRAGWSGNHAANCVVANVPVQPPGGGIKLGKAKPPAAIITPVQPVTQMATIISDVDLYDVPGGVGRVIGVLRRGQQYPFGGCRSDRWCQLTGVGWVWGDFVSVK